MRPPRRPDRRPAPSQGGASPGRWWAAARCCPGGGRPRPTTSSGGSGGHRSCVPQDRPASTVRPAPTPGKGLTTPTLGAPGPRPTFRADRRTDATHPAAATAPGRRVPLATGFSQRSPAGSTHSWPQATNPASRRTHLPPRRREVAPKGREGLHDERPPFCGYAKALAARTIEPRRLPGPCTPALMANVRVQQRGPRGPSHPGDVWAPQESPTSTELCPYSLRRRGHGCSPVRSLGESNSPGRVDDRGCCFCLNTECARRDSNP